MDKKIRIFDVNVDLLNMDETLRKITSAVKQHHQIEHVGMNSSKAVQIEEDPKLKKIVQDADMVNVDGMSMVKAVKWVRGTSVQRVTGIDTMIKLMKVAEREGFSVYFLGTKQAILEEMVGKLQKEYPKLKIAGYRNGYFKKNDEKEVVAEINNSGADMLFVGITSPFKEFFINRNKEALTPSLLMGVGGSFDVISGEISRAPEFMQNHGLEWMYRLSQEPKRLIKRYTVDNVTFLKMLIKEKRKFHRQQSTHTDHNMKGMYHEEQN